MCFDWKFERGDLVKVYGKISQPETFLGTDYKTYHGEIMEVVEVWEDLVELRWFGHRR